jgi:four helix bundle protein
MIEAMKAQGKEKPRDLRDRTREYALRIIRVYVALPKSSVAQVIGNQMLRSGTSVGANYREAIRARSRTEYATKLQIGLMELEETLYWIELLEAIQVFSVAKLAGLKAESCELCAILVTLINKLRGRK